MIMCHNDAITLYLYLFLTVQGTFILPLTVTTNHIWQESLLLHLKKQLRFQDI